MDQPVSLRQRYQAGKADVLTPLALPGASARGVRSALQRLARLTDDTLRSLWTQAGFGPDLALVAVGGYGRGELFPHSDVDVLVLLPDGAAPERDEALKAQLEAFIGSCWDTGLEIGSSVRQVADCVAEASADVTVQTAMLVLRWFAGDKAA